VKKLFHLTEKNKIETKVLKCMHYVSNVILNLSRPTKLNKLSYTKDDKLSLDDVLKAQTNIELIKQN